MLQLVLRPFIKIDEISALETYDNVSEHGGEIYHHIALSQKIFVIFKTGAIAHAVPPFQKVKILPMH